MIEVDSGRAYGLPKPSFDAGLTLVGRGTPMGELLRRYWHPIGLTSDATTTPKAVRALGEDLILFRDKQGRPGLLYSRCAHRGANLLYGRCDDGGIRCCYHGWMFDTEGHCLDQPMELGGGRARAHIRQPWYPVRELYGLIFAYLGPEEKQPTLPRYDALEVLDEGETLATDDTSIGGGGPAILPCNWLQHYENVLDSTHFPWLHYWHSGPQFGAPPGGMPDPSKHLESVSWEETEHGVMTVAPRVLVECVLPTLRCVPDPFAIVAGRGAGRCETIGWVLPIDDTSYRIYCAGRTRVPGVLRKQPPMGMSDRDRNTQMTAAERQKYPNDYEAQVGQGPITLHSEEHLVAGDRGVVLLRRLFRRQLELLAQGGDPINVTFDPDAAPVVFSARHRHDVSHEKAPV
jgi:nitrite reductase/ring-hydroxylating ferredoxin subunit